MMTGSVMSDVGCELSSCIVLTTVRNSDLASSPTSPYMARTVTKVNSNFDECLVVNWIRSVGSGELSEI